MENWRIRQKKRREGNVSSSTSTKSTISTTPSSTKSRLNSIQQIPLMNRDTLRTISEFLPPDMVHKTLINSTSIAMNKIGEIYYLCENGEIRYLSTRGGSGNSNEDTNINGFLSQKLDLNVNDNNMENISEMNMCHLEFNYSNTSLLVAGSSCLGIITLHDTNIGQFKNGNKNKFQVSYRCPIGDEILKVQWHPLNDTHLVILLQSQKLLLFDVLSSQTTEIPLDCTKDYISFTFGPCIDWMRLCLFLLDSHGDVSYVCPILPLGSVLSSHSIYELKQWISDQRNLDEGYNNPRGVFLDSLDLYLRSSFGTYFDKSRAASEFEEEEVEPTQTFHRAGVLKQGLQLTPGTLFHKSFYQVPCLQGPIAVEGRILKTGNAQDTIPCDISVAIARGYNAVPALFIVWSDGNIEELLISGQIAPSWTKSATPDSRSVLEAPVLVHMETLSLNLSQDFREISKQALTVSVPQDEYYLVPDPILGHSFHLVGPTSGMSYLVYISWLEREFDPSYPINSSNSYDSPLDPNRSLDQSSIIGGDEGMNTKQFFPTSTVLITCDGKNPSGAISSINNPLDRQISGVFVCPDPTQGHVQLVRYSDGYLAAVNITIQRKLLQLEGRIKNRTKETDSLQSTAAIDNIYEQKEYSLHWISQKLIKKAFVGIESVPYMGGNRKASTSECLESLLHAKQHLDSHVILPLEQLYQRMKFNEQIIRDVYEGQVAMLTGGGKSDGDGGAGDGAGDDDSETIIGIENKLKLIQKNQKKLKERIENVSKKLIQQKNLSASALSATQSSRHHPQVAISYAERCYYLQLKSWDEILQKYEKLIKNITISKEYLSQSHGPSAPSSSLMSGVGGNLMDLIQLSEDEERICEKLLGSQGEALKITNDAAMELESRLHSFM